MTIPSRPLAWLPNALTLSRAALAPVILAVLAAPPLLGIADNPVTSLWPPAAAALLALAGALDWLDGRLARAWGVESDFGRIWDPIADKLVIAAGLVGGAVVYPGMIVILPAALILWRDAAVTWLRRNPSTADAVVTPSRLAKWKTALEYAALFALFSPALVAMGVNRIAGQAVSGAAFIVLVATGLALLWIAAALALITGWRYLLAARRAASSPESANR